MFFGEYMYTFLLDLHQGAELLGQRESTCSALTNSAKQISRILENEKKWVFFGYMNHGAENLLTLKVVT